MLGADWLEHIGRFIDPYLANGANVFQSEKRYVCSRNLSSI